MSVAPFSVDSEALTLPSIVSVTGSCSVFTRLNPVWCAWQMPVWVWTALVFGGTLMVALTCWLIYFKFYAAGAASSPLPRPPPAPLSPPAAQQASPPAGEAEGSTSAAAKAAIIAAADAQAAADKSLNLIAAQHPQPDKMPAEPAPAAPA